MAETTCSFKHTKYQPTDEEFCCPKCGAPGGDFCVDESPNYVCELLHEDDGLVCYGKGGKGCKAQYGTDGKSFAARLQKAKNLVCCPTCKGSGLVKKDQ